jgi:hypothetical protein
MWKYVATWVPMVFIAIANGAVREAWYAKRLSELRAHQISTASGLLLLGAYMWFIVYQWPPDSGQAAAAMGMTWLALTVAFELLFGRYVGRHSWGRLFRDYNLFAGRVWLLVLIWVAIAPCVFLLLQRQ